MKRLKLIADDLTDTPLKPADLANIQKHIRPHLPELKAEAGIAFVTAARMRDLNATFRGKDKATNVLSFPQYTPRQLKRLKESGTVYLGDIALHLPTLRTEAKTAKKPLKHHLIHLVVHGALHLLGYDHTTDRGAAAMEALEKDILASCGIPDPYEDREPVPNRKKNKKTGSRTRR